MANTVQTHVNFLPDVDCAKEQDGAIMLGTLANQKCFNTSACETMLNSIVRQRMERSGPMPEVLTKTLEYCKRFQTVSELQQAPKIQKRLAGPVPYIDPRDPDPQSIHEGHRRPKKVMRCRDFEAAQLINLAPATAEEAVELIPTLKDNEWLGTLIREVQKNKAKNIDRGIGSMIAMDPAAKRTRRA